MLRERPRAGRSRQHARQIENPHARKGPRAMLIGAGSGNRLTVRVAEGKYLDHRHSRECDPLRMNAPLVGAAKLRSAYAALGERILERLSVPRRDGIRDRVGVIVAFQKRERAFARTESAMQMNPSPVARPIERGRGL